MDVCLIIPEFRLELVVRDTLWTPVSGPLLWRLEDDLKMIGTIETIFPCLGSGAGSRGTDIEYFVYLKTMPYVTVANLRNNGWEDLSQMSAQLVKLY
jgi:hypothetical protein